jgi:hypothetical protein
MSYRKYLKGNSPKRIGDSNPKLRFATRFLMKQKAEITFEVEETFVVKPGERMTSEYCPNCQAVSVMTTPEILASMTGSSEREIFRLVEAGVIHFVERRRIYACPGCFRNSIAPALLEERRDPATTKLGELK